VPQGHWKTITFVAALRRNRMRAPCTSLIDNLSAHKAAGIREAIEACGPTLRYLPQYSPDPNPIEMPFSKLKASLCKAAERTIPRLRVCTAELAGSPAR
jgi:transposase